MKLHPSVLRSAASCLALIVLLAAATARAQRLDNLPNYKTAKKVSGTIRLWGHGSPDTDFMGKLVNYWIAGFQKYQPDVKFDNRMYGTASAIGALYTDTGDMAIMGREIRPFEIASFEKIKGHPPVGIDITTGSLDIRNMDYALVVFVHRSNPLSKLSMTQLDAIFGYEHKRGAKDNIRTWGQLGLKGEWADKPVHPYGYSINKGFSVFFEDAALGGSHKWNPDLREYTDVKQPDGMLLDGGQQILDALAKDPYGIAYSNLRYQNGLPVKPLALAPKENGKYFAATKENLINRNYPLTRFITTFIDRQPGKPVDPKVKEFLRYILSREGQADIMRDGKYLPLSAAAVQEQLKKLE